MLACPQFRSAVNLARIARLAGCSGVKKLVACGQTKVDPKIARNSLDYLEIQRRRTLTSWLKEARKEQYHVTALEQSDSSVSLYDYQFPKKCILLIGHERLGVAESDLQLADDIIEIPVYGQPASYNVVTATTMAVYEYCRQHPNG